MELCELIVHKKSVHYFKILVSFNFFSERALAVISVLDLRDAGGEIKLNEPGRQKLNRFSPDG